MTIHNLLAEYAIFVLIHLIPSMMCHPMSSNGMHRDDVKLLPTHPENGGEFGASVDIQGNRVIVGSPGSSSVYIYSLENIRSNAGVRISRDESICGISVAIEGDIAAFTCESCGGNGGLSCAYIMKFNGTSWNEDDKLTDLGGHSIHVNYGYVYITNKRYRNEPVSVSVYTYTNGNWTLRANILSDDLQAGGMNGDVTAVDRNHLVIGASLYDLDNVRTDVGRVHVYTREGVTLRRTQTIDAPNPVRSGQFGASVDINGDRMAVGYLSDSSNTNGGRSVRVYKRNGSLWYPEGKLTSPDVAGRDGFGNSISIGDDIILVGAHSDMELGYDSGSVYLFTYVNKTWVETSKFLPITNDLNQDGQGDRFGISVAMSNGVAVVGSDHSDNQDRRQSGSAYIFYLQEEVDPTTASPLATIATSNRTNISSGAAMFSMTCSEYNVTGYWSKNILTADELRISLLFDSCDNYESNQTTVWLTAPFGGCGSVIEEHDDVIVQKNVATVFMTTFINGIVRRTTHHKYNMECIFPRVKNVSMATGYNVTDVAKEWLFNISRITGFDVYLQLYHSAAFAVESSYPIDVAMDEPIYIGIKKVAANTDIKIVVNKCFATPTANIHGDAYIFFHERCPLDRTFRVVQSDANNFNFVINAFKFIQISDGVFIHCRLLICTSNSTSEKCDQTCRARKRRSPNENSPTDGPDIQEVTYLTSGRINFVKKRRCRDHACPINSRCFDAFPAVCRCDQGYVFLPSLNVCSNTRILKLKNIYTAHAWLDGYANPSSLEYIRLVENTRRDMLELFAALNMTDDVKGVKVSEVRRGSVIIDLLVCYSDEVSKQYIYETFVTAMKNGNKTKTLFQNARVVTSRSSFVAIAVDDDDDNDDVIEHVDKTRDTTILLIVVGVLVGVSVLLVTGGVIFKVVHLKTAASRRSGRPFEAKEMSVFKGGDVFERKLSVNSETFIERKLSVNSETFMTSTNGGFVRKRADSTAVNILHNLYY